MKKLIITVGLAGSGKTTLANKLAKENNGVVFSTDDFFMKDGAYHWDYKFLTAAHKWCLGNVAHSMFNEVEYIVVANTSLQSWTLLPYAELAADAGYTMELVEPKTKWANDPVGCFEKGTHNVPLATLEKMKSSRESLKVIKETLISKMKSVGKTLNVS